jgi:hypothetical protein
MRLTDSFWKHYELDLQEVKIAYLNWAIDYAKEQGSEHRHLFLWDHQKSFCLVDSRYGRAFAISPFGVGVRWVPSPKVDGLPRGLDEMDIALKARLSESTNKIRFAIRKALLDGNVDEA